MTTKVTRTVLDADVRPVTAINFATNATLKINSSLVNQGILVTNGSGQMSALVPGNSKVITTSGTGALQSTAYATAGTPDTIVMRDGSGEFGGTAAQARYADLAERYESDDSYDAGTVMMLGGDREVTIADDGIRSPVIGVVSAKPGFKMNAQAGKDKTHPYIALRGRVPCKVEGRVRAGQALVPGSTPGVARGAGWLTSLLFSGAVVGRAIKDDDREEIRLVEIVV